MNRPHGDSGAGRGAGRDGAHHGGPARRARGGLTPHRPKAPAAGPKPALNIFTTTLWEYPSQHYGDTPRAMQGDAKYIGATPSWVIWQLLQRYTKPGDLVVDPMCGSGTTIDVARDTGRRAIGYDLQPTRPDIFKADARQLPLESGKADLVFMDPPYSTHVRYSDDPRCIGTLDAGQPGGAGGINAYYGAMDKAITETHRVLKPGGYLGLYVSDSFKKTAGVGTGESPSGLFMPIGFELFSIMRRLMTPVDIVAVVRHNQKLDRANWHDAARDGGFFLRGFNYLFIMWKGRR